MKQDIDRAELITRIRRVTIETKAALADHRNTKAQDKRCLKAIRELFDCVGLEKPTDEEAARCYPW